MTVFKYSALVLTIFCIFTSESVFAGNNSGSAFSIWPDTGQATCYDGSGNILDPCPAEDEPFHGQDAQYQGPVQTFTVLGGGIMVQDNLTGLIWERKQNKDGTKDYTNPHDADNTYTWCDTNPNTNGGSQGICGTNNSEEFIDALNNSSFGGYSDWRLPTLKELMTIIDYTSYHPAVDTSVFPNTVSYNWSYWTATTCNTTGAWYVNTDNGVDYTAGKGGYYHVRAVRSDL